MPLAKLTALTYTIKSFGYDIEHLSLGRAFFLVDVKLGNVEKILIKNYLWVSYLIFP